MQTPPWVKISEAVFIATLILAGPFHFGIGLGIMLEPKANPTPAEQRQKETVGNILATGCAVSWPCILAASIWHERLRSKWNRSRAASANPG